MDLICYLCVRLKGNPVRIVYERAKSAHNVCRFIQMKMADTIIPVPIYDQQFASIIDMLPSAKYIQSFSVQSMGPATISF